MVDDRLKREFHYETVGILICGSKNDHTVRYALGRAASPMAVSAYTYEQLPAAVLGSSVRSSRAAVSWTAD